MNMLEKIARAICLRHGGVPDVMQEIYKKDDPGAVAPYWKWFEADARVALAALRELTEEMRDAGRKANALEPGNCLGLQYVAPEPAWFAMIDAASAPQRN